MAIAPKTQDTRERVLEAAACLFAERGFDVVSVRQIAAQAEANLGAITYHFGSKERLFAEIVSREMEVFRARASEIASSEMTPEGKLRALFEGYALRVLHERPQLRLFFAECLSGGRRLPPAAQVVLDTRNRIFRDAVMKGISDGTFRDVDVENACWMFFGMLSAYILFEPLMGRPVPRAKGSRQFVKHIVDVAMGIFLNGLRSQPGHGVSK